MVEAPEPPHHHHHPTSIPWFDFVVPIAIICISVASLITSLESEKSMHALVEQNSRLVSAQSTPILMLDSGNQSDDGKAILGMSLSNVGTGPAQVAWLRITDLQGNDMSARAIEKRVASLDPKINYFATQRIDSTFLRSGDTRNVFAWPKPPADSPSLAEWNNLNQLRFHLKASACYCSLFDECKITHFADTKPQPVPTCDAPEK